MTFTIPGRMPGANEITQANRSHKWKGVRQKKVWVKLVWTYIRLYRIPAFKTPVGIRIDWFEPNNKRDIDNISAGTKVILDALVTAGCIPNDSRRWVKSLVHDFPAPDPDNPRVEVHIEPV